MASFLHFKAGPACPGRGGRGVIVVPGGHPQARPFIARQLPLLLKGTPKDLSTCDLHVYTQRAGRGKGDAKLVVYPTKGANLPPAAPVARAAPAGPALAHSPDDEPMHLVETDPGSDAAAGDDAALAPAPEPPAGSPPPQVRAPPTPSRQPRRIAGKGPLLTRTPQRKPRDLTGQTLLLKRELAGARGAQSQRDAAANGAAPQKHQKATGTPRGREAPRRAGPGAQSPTDRSARPKRPAARATGNAADPGCAEQRHHTQLGASTPQITARTHLPHPSGQAPDPPSCAPSPGPTGMLVSLRCCTSPRVKKN